MNDNSEVCVVSKTVKYKGAHYRSKANGGLQVLMFGWYPTGTNPRYQWENISKEKVPPSVLRALQ